MRLFIGMLYTETNTFSPLFTGWSSFADGGLARGTASEDPASAIGIVLAEWRRLAEAENVTVIEGTAAAAQPAGRTLQSVYESLRDDLLREIEAAGPLDIVLLYLHGAMAAIGYDDCEGDLLARVRQRVGDKVVIGAELDLHCHFTDAMLENADVLIAYKEYPHTDEIARARELFAICHAAALGHLKPVMAMFDCRMIGLWRTTEEPMRSFVGHMTALEGEVGVLSVSLGHGFPWGDVANVGARALVVTDGDGAKAATLARELGLAFYDMREQTKTDFLSVEQALSTALAAPNGPVVIGDVADNTGGGAPGDSTFFLRACIQRGIRGVAIACIYDPGAVGLCREAGIGARFELRIGGKLGASSGDPVDLSVTVRGLSEDHRQTGLGGDSVPLGRAAWVEAGGIDIVLSSRREQVFSPDVFSGLGLDPRTRRVLIVKSTQHFHAGFSPIASSVLYATSPGAIAPDFAQIRYTKRDGRYWPRVPDPWAGD